MNPETALWLSLGAAVLALVYGVVSVRWILGQSSGSERMQSIAAAVQEGAKAYMNRQYAGEERIPSALSAWCCSLS